MNLQIGIVTILAHGGASDASQSRCDPPRQFRLRLLFFVARSIRGFLTVFRARLRLTRTDERIADSPYVRL